MLYEVITRHHGAILDLLAQTLQSHHEGTKALSERSDSPGLQAGLPPRGAAQTVPGSEAERLGIRGPLCLGAFVVKSLGPWPPPTQMPLAVSSEMSISA